MQGVDRRRPVFARPVFARRFLAACLWAVAAIAVGCGPGGSRFERPPIIIVDVDTLRADHLGCYGYGRDTSPSLDAWSAEAARFHWAFSQAPNTPPSQSSILTALYPSSHGRIQDEQKISPEVTTLAETLQAAGYDTAAFVDGGLMAAGFGLEQGFALYDDEAGGVEKIGPKAVDWLSRRLASPAATQPFLLLLHTYDVHSPYEDTPEPYRSTFLPGLELPSKKFVRRTNGLMKKAKDSWRPGEPPILTPQEIAYAKALYDGGIRHVDHWFSTFMTFLEQSDLYDDAIVVVISDHGDEFQEHGSVFHSRLYATVTRVPLMIRFPGGRYRGVFDDVVETIDLMPTLLEAVGVAAPPRLHGRSLVPLLAGEPGRPELAVGESPFWGRQIAVTGPELRLIFTERKEQTELFAYRSDPLEQREVGAAHPEDARQLLDALHRWQQLVRQQQYQGGEVEELDEATLEQLRTLGYVD